MEINNLRNTAYNNHLFKTSSLRRFLHLARYQWVLKMIEKYNIKTKRVIEIGCYDAKIIEFLKNKPSRYFGYDANWGEGINIASEKYSRNKEFSFIKADNPSEIDLNNEEPFDLALCMETLEHVDDSLVCPYLELISKKLSGYLLITCPNEKGLFFLLKRLLKPTKDNEQYSLKDIINISLGRTNYVIRDQHKGFDYDHLIYDIKKYFEIIEISGHPLGKFLPKRFCFGVGIIAISKTFN